MGIRARMISAILSLDAFILRTRWNVTMGIPVPMIHAGSQVASLVPTAPHVTTVMHAHRPTDASMEGARGKLSHVMMETSARPIAATW